MVLTMTTAAIKTLSFYRTSVGKKTVMAVTGLLMLLFVVMHMLGNLQIFAGPEKLNAYAAFLRGLPGPIWGLRGLMALALLLHVFTALLLIVQSLLSRPVRYKRRTYQEATASSRTMLYTGPLLLAYLVYHLLDQTFGTVHASFNPDDVYDNVIVGFSDLRIAGGYIFAMLLLLLHLKHGIWSLFQTLGLNIPRYDPTIRAVAVLLALALAAGYISIPAAVLAGWLN
jgi:succinate dehydrogenase / fumarate reductase cytochrome b subunit